MLISTRWMAGWLLAAGFVLLAAQAQAADDDEPVRVADVLAAMHHNHAAADEQYVGKQLQLQGLAVNVERARKNEGEPVEYLLKLSSERAGPGPGGQLPTTITCIFSAKERPGLADIKRGSIVIIHGRCHDELSSNGLVLRFDDCRLIRIIDAPSPAPAPTSPDRGPGTLPSLTPPSDLPMRTFPAPAPRP